MLPLTVTVILSPSEAPGTEPTAWVLSSPLVAESLRTTWENSDETPWMVVCLASPPPSMVPVAVVTVATLATPSVFLAS